MQPLPRRCLATAALFLALGVALGIVMLWRREVWGVWPSPYLVSAHVHLLLPGAVLQTILGVALWLFPRPARDDRTPVWMAPAAWGMLAAGTLLRAIAEVARSSLAADGWRWVVVAGALVQVLGLIASVLALRPRVRSPSDEAARRARGMLAGS